MIRRKSTRRILSKHERRWREPPAIAAEIDRVRPLRLDALRRQWGLVFGRVPHAGKHLLGRMILSAIASIHSPALG